MNMLCLTSTMDKFMKQTIINNILAYLTQELAVIETAARNAHLAAIDEQSIADTQYDTLAIEASYLAQGQSKRARELQQAITQIKALSIDAKNYVTQGALVQVAQSDQTPLVKQWFFIAPAAAGFNCAFEQQKVTVISPDSPLGNVLMNCFVDDDIDIVLGNRRCQYQILAIH